MNPQVLSFFTLVLGLLAGTALGWFLGNRPVADWRRRFEARDLDARELDEKFRRAIVDLAGTAERAARVDELADALDLARQAHATETENLRQDRARVVDEKALLSAELAALNANVDNFEEQKRLLREAQDMLRKEFENAGNKVLEKAQETFLTRAQERFTESEKTNAERLSTLLAPVGQRLEQYEKQVQELESRRGDAFGQLKGVIEEMRIGQEQVKAEAARLGNSLRSAPKASGRWGELQVENVLEKCGLSPHTDFRSEASISSEDGRLRPDFVVDIPGNKKLIIDSKNIWADYDRAFSSDDLSERDVHLKAHVAAVKSHITALSSKSYYSHWEGSAEYVVLFIPGEHLLYAALEQDSALWNFAFDKNVLLATPTNLVAIAKTVARVWQQVGLEKDAREIGKLASDLYDSLAKTQDDLIKTGTYLGRAVNAFNAFSKTYEGNVLGRARRLTDMHIRIGKRQIVEDVAFVEAASHFAESSETAILPSDLSIGGEAVE